jgi:hypothetical protein
MYIYELPRPSTFAYATSLPLFLMAALGKARITPARSLVVLLLTQSSWQFANKLYIKYLERELKRSQARTRMLEKEIIRLNAVARRADAEIERIDEEIRWWRDGWHFEEEDEEQVEEKNEVE